MPNQTVIRRLFTRPGDYPFRIDPGPGQILRAQVTAQCGGAGAGGDTAYLGGTGGGGGAYAVYSQSILTLTGIAEVAQNVSLSIALGNLLDEIQRPEDVPRRRPDPGAEAFMDQLRDLMRQFNRTEAFSMESLPSFPEASVLDEIRTSISVFSSTIRDLQARSSAGEQLTNNEMIQLNELPGRLQRFRDQEAAFLEAQRTYVERSAAVRSRNLQRVLNFIRAYYTVGNYCVRVGEGGRGGQGNDAGNPGGSSKFFHGSSNEQIFRLYCEAKGGTVPDGGTGSLPRARTISGGNGQTNSSTTGSPSFPQEGSINVGDVPCSGGGGSGANATNAFNAGIGQAKWPGGGRYNNNGLPKDDESGAGGDGLTSTVEKDGARQGSPGTGGGGGRGGFTVTDPDSAVVTACANGGNGAHGSVLITITVDTTWANPNIPGRAINGPINGL